MQKSIRDIQSALIAKGYDVGRAGADGIMGSETEKAVVAFKRASGLNPRPYIGPITLAKLFDVKDAPSPGKAFGGVVPWVNELGRVRGLHEVRDYSALSRWLKSDGRTLGDPRKHPWCGDAVQTAIALALPNEPFPDRVGENPYLARNWLDFGQPCSLRYGAVVVLWRGSRTGVSGHVAFAIGYDPVKRMIRVRGGNQSNQISDTWVRQDRVLGCRAPVTWTQGLPPIPTMNSAGAVISTNEA